jgi:hypothetical protein
MSRAVAGAINKNRRVAKRGALSVHLPPQTTHLLPFLAAHANLFLSSGQSHLDDGIADGLTVDSSGTRLFCSSLFNVFDLLLGLAGNRKCSGTPGEKPEQKLKRSDHRGLIKLKETLPNKGYLRPTLLVTVGHFPHTYVQLKWQGRFRPKKMVLIASVYRIGWYISLHD